MTERRGAILVVLCAVGGGTIVLARRGYAARRRRIGNQHRAEAVRAQVIREVSADLAPFAEPTVMLVMAAFNEAEVVGRVLSEVPSTVCGLPVVPVVVVDGATDSTQEVVERSGALALVHPTNLGQGAALHTGFEVARRRGATVVVTLDADGQHDPLEMEHLVEPVVADSADYVQGSRFTGHYDDAGSARHLGIVVLTRVVNFLSGAGVTDCANGYRAIRGASLSGLRLDELQFSAAELIVESARTGLRMREVPVHIRTRVAGESKKPRRLAYPLGYLAVAWRTARRSSPGRSPEHRR